MSAKAFFDTNIIVYAYSAKDLDKRSKARELIESHDAIISTQVINEVANVLTKKFRLPWSETEQVLKETIANFEVVLLSTDLSLNACKLSAEYSHSYYDSLIVATALANNCSVLYSEDMQHKQKIHNKLIIFNPFR